MCVCDTERFGGFGFGLAEQTVAVTTCEDANISELTGRDAKSSSMSVSQRSRIG